MSEVRIRQGIASDLEALTAIYNYYIRETPITFDIDEFTVDQRRAWFEHYHESGRHRLLVAEDGGVVLGYATSSPWRPKKAYDPSVEVSVYLADDAKGRGIGTALYEALFAALAGEDIHRAMAGITVPNDPSIALHKKFGFTQAAVFTENGRKFGKYWDVVWMEKAL